MSGFWKNNIIETAEGPVKALRPLVLSVSRRTDVPAWFSDQFMDSLKKGSMKWKHPLFPDRSVYLDLTNVRMIVFWTKDPRPMIRHLGSAVLKDRMFYFLYTLNNYESEAWEPGIPLLQDRIKTFRDLSKRLGHKRVIWRFDPLLVSADLSAEQLGRRILDVAENLKGYTQKLIISFGDLDQYRKVRVRIRGTMMRELNKHEKETVCKIISCLRSDFQIFTCAEREDFSTFGITKGACVDPDLIRNLTENDPVMRKFFVTHRSLKDRGQRKECLCMVSKDTGIYQTCRTGCLYCYAL